MSRADSDTPAVLFALQEAARDYAGQSVMFHQAIADALGVNVTDLKCLDLARGAGEITPGKLAELTGLTSGTVTAVLDRLERAGYVRRERDTKDRRKVLVKPVQERLFSTLIPIFDALGQAIGREFGARYSTAELELILDFVQRSGQVLHNEMLRLRAQ
jgi:DNA-binding MarR family transcriptional regulator